MSEEMAAGLSVSEAARPKLKAWMIRRIGESLATIESNGDRLQLIDAQLDLAWQESKAHLPHEERIKLFTEIRSEFLGYGIIQPLLDDPTISEIMINGPDQVYVERKGRIELSEVQFSDDRQVLELAEKIILPLGRRVDEESPTVDARLPDGSRVNVVIAPVAIDGTIITIRKFSREKLSIDDLIALGSISESMAKYIEACVVARMNILVSGGTGSGKTTLLNILSSFIPSHERILTIEDAAELQLQQTHVVRLEAKPANIEGRGEVPIRHLVKNALRMRPERIIVGEVRSQEAIDMLQAMNTGHDGSMTTLHANTPRDAISRLETLVLMSGLDLPLRVVRQQIVSAVDLIVQQTRMRDGTRKVTSITEVVGMEGEVAVLSEIFRFEETGVGENGEVLGGLTSTGIRSMFDKRLEMAGFHLPPDIYGADLAMMSSNSRRRR